MKKLWLLIIFICSISCVAQTTTVTATIVDSDSTVWFNAKVTAVFVPNPNYPNYNQYNINGVSLSSNTYSGYLNQQVSTNSSGVFTVTLLDNSQIAPIGSSWKFVIQSYTSAPSSVLPNLPVQGSSINLSSFINANITAPRLSAISAFDSGGAYAYNTTEIAVIPIPGGTFFNVTTQLTNVWSGTQWNQQAVGNFCSLSGCTYTGNINLITTPPGPNNPISPYTLNTLFNDFTPGTSGLNIQGAMAAAGAASNGSVTIGANYTSGDAITSNNFNTNVLDRRPHNPTNNSIYQGPTAGPMPQTTIKAADYGVLCNGINDDTAALQKAVAAFNTIAGGVGLAGQQAMTNGAIELPQGRCETSSTIVMPNYGSIIGSPNGTWWSPLEPWQGTDYNMLEISQSYVGNGGAYYNQPNSLSNRQVRGINFWYNYNAHAFTAIQIINYTGHTSTYPYPGGATSNPGGYQLPQVEIASNLFYTMDTGIDLEDCNGCNIHDNKFSYLRVGLVDTNAYSTVATNNNFIVGSYAYTTVTSGGTSGIYSSSQTRWSCNGGTGQSCTGGSIVQDIIASPQGLTLSGNTFEDWDRDANIVNCLAFIANNNGFDTGGDNTNTPNPTIYLGQLKFAQIYDNFAASNRTDSPTVEIAALTGNQLTGLNNQDGIWIYNNIFYSYNPSTSSGIQFDPGTIARRNAHIDGNQFTNFAYGISLLSPLIYSTVNGNYGATLTSALLNFNNSVGFNGTVIRDNTESDSGIPIYVNPAGAGLRVEWNNSPSQITGNFTWTGAGCAISAGAIGNNCSTTVSVPTGMVGFPDLNFQIQGCSITGQTGGPATIGLISTPTLGGTFPVYEYSLSTSAVSGGTIKCAIYHP